VGIMAEIRETAVEIEKLRVGVQSYFGRVE